MFKRSPDSRTKMAVADKFPAVLTDSNEFRSLNADQVSSLGARFRHIVEIIENVERWIEGKNADATLRSFLDDLELDLSSVQGWPGDQEKEQSSWLIHSSWTFEASPSAMRRAIPQQIVDALDSQTPGVAATGSEVQAWLRGQVLSLRLVIEQLYTASSFAGAIAALIAVDVLLANMLVGVYKTRLNPAL
jgi:hypothetical protein